jgi:hypothetical protein
MCQAIEQQCSDCNLIRVTAIDHGHYSCKIRPEVPFRCCLNEKVERYRGPVSRGFCHKWQVFKGDAKDPVNVAGPRDYDCWLQGTFASQAQSSAYD